VLKAVAAFARKYSIKKITLSDIHRLCEMLNNF